MEPNFGSNHDVSAWKKGPLPPDTYYWGGVVPLGVDVGDGFLFADFCGDHVMLTDGRRLEADQVAWYNNGIHLPPRS